MVATLFYTDELPDAGSLAVLGGDEGFHAATVRRIRPGERLVLGDGAGGLARCEVEHAGRDGLRARVLERWTVAPPNPPVTVVQALPKSERSELAVELATEAGAVVLALHESATDRLTDVPVAQAKSLFLVIGPEGGIADDELAALRQAGALSVRLGPQVLRTSTAAAVALGALGVLTPRWDDAASP